MVTFNTVPSSSRVPFLFLEFDGSQAQQEPGLQPYKLLVLGYRKTAGTVAQKTPTLVTSAESAATFFGQGSMLHAMAVALFKNNKTTQATFLALDASGVAATGTVTITGTASGSGTLALYVAGELVQVTITSGDSPTVIGDSIVAAINAKSWLPVTAANAVGVVTLTAVHAGTEGNGIDVRLNRFAGETTPAGVTVAIAAVGSVVAGSGSPTLDASVWGTLGDEHFNVVAVGFDGKVGATLTAVETEMDDRAGPTRALEGIACFWVRDTHSNLITLGDAQNAKYLSAMTLGPADLTPAWASSAAYAGVLAREGKADPARPFQTLELAGVVAPDAADLFTLQERDLLLHDGIATAKANASGGVAIERAITLYQENPAGANDTAFLDVNTVLTLGYLRWDTRTRFAAKYPRHKLADDGTRFGAGQSVLTPAAIRAELLGYFLEWESLGLVEGFAQFKSDLIVERSTTDPTRVDVVLSPDLINQLRVVGAAIRFLL